VLPSLSSSSKLDKSIKTTLMGDTLTLIGMPYSDNDKNINRNYGYPEI